MKDFFRGAVPQPRSILAIESGSPHILRRALGGIRQMFPEAQLHLCTCWPDPAPDGVSTLFRVADYPSQRDKIRLLLTFRRSRYDVLVILCSQEPIMYAWKMMVLLLVPAKTLIVNENGDFFWLDWQNRGALRQFLATRWVIIRKEFLLTILRAIVFPFTLLFLIANAVFFYARRWRRLLLWKIRELSAPHTGPSQSASLYSENPPRKSR
jgi:hypothetical protein